MTKQQQLSVADMHIDACYMTDLNHFIDRPQLHKKMQYWYSTDLLSETMLLLLL